MSVSEAKFAINEAHLVYVMDDTPDLKRHGKYRKRVDCGLNGRGAHKRRIVADQMPS